MVPTRASFFVCARVPRPWRVSGEKGVVEKKCSPHSGNYQSQRSRRRQGRAKLEAAGPT